MAAPGQPFFQPSPSQIASPAKPQGAFNPNAFNQAKVHAVIDVSPNPSTPSEFSYVFPLQRVKTLKQAGFTEDNSPDLAKMVAFLKMMAQQRKRSIVLLAGCSSLQVQRQSKPLTTTFLP